MADAANAWVIEQEKKRMITHAQLAIFNHFAAICLSRFKTCSLLLSSW